MSIDLFFTLNEALNVYSILGKTWSIILGFMRCSTKLAQSLEGESFLPIESKIVKFENFMSFVESLKKFKKIKKQPAWFSLVTRLDIIICVRQNNVKRQNISSNKKNNDPCTLQFQLKGIIVMPEGFGQAGALLFPGNWCVCKPQIWNQLPIH